MLVSIVKNSLVFIILFVLYVRFNKWYRRERVREFGKKSVFVTGTDTGFGKLLVAELDKKGLKVYAGCYTKEGAEELRKTSSERVKIIMIDVTDRESIVAARDFIVKDLGPNEELWGLVNNAGIMRGVMFDFCQLNDYRQTMEVNFYGVISTTEIFLPLIKRSRGRIVVMSSSAGRCNIVTTPYSCSKHALEPYGDGLRKSMKTFGVQVAIIEPGVYPTPLSAPEVGKAEIDRTWKNLPDDLKREYGEEYKDIFTENYVKITTEMVTQLRKNPEHVIKTIIHALSSKRPKARYTIGTDAKLGIAMTVFCPDWMTDHMMRNGMKYDHIPMRSTVEI